MDVEFEEMKELVRNKVNRAIDVFLYAKEEFEGSAGFVAGWEWDILELARGIRDLFQVSEISHAFFLFLSPLNRITFHV